MKNAPEGQTIEENDVFQQLIHKKSAPRTPDAATEPGRKLIDIMEAEHDEIMYLSTLELPSATIG